MLSRGGASELASNVRCSSMYACCFTGCGAFARISVLGPTGCLTVLAAARCPGRQHPAGDPAFFCPVVQHLLQLCQCPAVGQYRRRCAVALLPPLVRAVLIHRRQKKREKHILHGSTADGAWLLCFPR